MIVLLTSLKDADKYLYDNPDGLKDCHVTCAFPVDAGVFFWFLRHTAWLKVDCGAECVEMARKFKAANNPDVLLQ